MGESEREREGKNTHPSQLIGDEVCMYPPQIKQPIYATPHHMPRGATLYTP